MKSYSLATNIIEVEVFIETLAKTQEDTQAPATMKILDTAEADPGTIDNIIGCTTNLKSLKLTPYNTWILYNGI